MKRSVLGVATPRFVPLMTAWKRLLIVSPMRLESATERCSGLSTSPIERLVSEIPPPGTLARRRDFESSVPPETGSTNSAPSATARTWPSRTLLPSTAISERRVSISQPPTRLDVSLSVGTSTTTSKRSPLRTPGGR